MAESFNVTFTLGSRQVASRVVEADGASAALEVAGRSLAAGESYDLAIVSPGKWAGMSRDEVLKDLASVLPPRR